MSQRGISGIFKGKLFGSIPKKSWDFLEEFLQLSLEKSEHKSLMEFPENSLKNTTEVRGKFFREILEEIDEKSLKESMDEFRDDSLKESSEKIYEISRWILL